MRTVVVLGAVAVSACGGTWRATPEPELSGNGVANVGSATVVGAEQLRRSEGSLLRAIMGKVPNMKVSYAVGMSRCPSIAMRSFEDHRGMDRPSVYVDGTHVNDTCILETLDAREVDRVEIYPMGFTTRPGYGTNGAGLILVFLRRT